MFWYKYKWLKKKQDNSDNSGGFDTNTNDWNKQDYSDNSGGFDQILMIDHL